MRASKTAIGRPLIIRMPPGRPPPKSVEKAGAASHERSSLRSGKRLYRPIFKTTHLPITLKAGDKLDFDSGRIVQAYPVVELDADADSELSIEPYGVTYITRAGRQRHFTIDTQGISHGTIL
jgi:hypothetical protein